MRTIPFLALTGVILASFCCNAASAEDLVSRTSKGLKGCSLTALAVSDDGGLSLTGCDGPKGLYYSRDFGDNWTFAAGEEYQAGSASWAGFAGGKAYALVSGTLFKASLPGSSSETWTPSWAAALTNASSNTNIIFNSRYILMLTGNVIQVFDTASDTKVSELLLPANHQISKLAVTDTYAFVAGAGSGNTPNKIFKASISAAAALTSDWSDITASAMPGGTDMSNANIWSIFASQDTGRLLLTIRFQGGTNIDKAYVSNDGSTFTLTDLNGTVNMACAVNGTWLLGARYSLDDLAHASPLGQPVQTLDGGDVRFEDKGCAISRNFPAKALLATNQGVAKTTNLDAGPTSAWVSAVSGMNSIQVTKISRSKTNPDRVLLGTTAGVALTDNYSDPEPTWTFPICPGLDCVGGRNALLDPNNDQRFFYASGNIRRCTTTGTGALTVVNCTDFANHPGSFFFMGSFDIFTYEGLASRAYTAYMRTEGSIDGGLYYYDLETGLSTEVADPLLTHKPLNKFFPISSNVMYVARGSGNDPDASYRGVVRSTDGGTTWASLSGGTPPDGRLVMDFAYDGARDILYAVTENVQGAPSPENQQEMEGKVYILRDALNGGANWEAASSVSPQPQPGQPGPGGPPTSFTTVDVDSGSGTVFASTRQEIWASPDQGQTWTLYFRGLPNETTSLLEVEQAQPAGQGFGILTSAARLTQGSNTGIYSMPVLLLVAPTPTPAASPTGSVPPAATPTPLPAAQCKLSVEQKCRKPVRKNTMCTFTATMKRSGRALAAPLALQRRDDPKSSWKKVMQKTTSKKGVVNYNAKVSKTGQYGLQSPAYACSTNIVKVSAKK